MNFTPPHLTSAVESIARQLIRKHNNPDNETFTDAVMSFVSAVDWSEKFIVGLLVSHLILFTIVVLTRKNWGAQMTFLIMTCACFVSKFEFESWFSWFT
jgi:hypothetical protein